MSPVTVFWIILAVFVIGLFIGSNLGVMLMCILHRANDDQDIYPEEEYE